MKVFISWSGERSHGAALLLKEWLPKLINEVKPWVSSEDIAVGGDWSADITQELNEARFGIICVTPENMNAPWILFEAGALSRQVENQPSRVAPFLIGFNSKSDLARPMGRFQATEPTKDDMLKLFKSLDAQCENRVGEVQLSQMLDLIWDKFTVDYKVIEDSKPDIPAPKRDNSEVLNEILTSVRALVASTASASEIQLLRSTKNAAPSKQEAVTLTVPKERIEALQKAARDAGLLFQVSVMPEDDDNVQVTLRLPPTQNKSRKEALLALASLLSASGILFGI